MFHDPGELVYHMSKLSEALIVCHTTALERTTDSTGNCHQSFLFSQALLTKLFTGQIKEKVWYGEKGMQHVRTKKEPKQSIPTFVETIDLLMKVRCTVTAYPGAGITFSSPTYPPSPKTTTSSSTLM
jgi:hypothetical protein